MHMKAIKYLIIALPLAVLTACERNPNPESHEATEQSMESASQGDPVLPETLDYEERNRYIGRVESSNPANPDLRDYYITVEIWVPELLMLSPTYTIDVSNADANVISTIIETIPCPSRQEASWVPYMISVPNNSIHLREDGSNGGVIDGKVNHTIELNDDFILEVIYGTNGNPKKYRLKDAKEKDNG